MARPTALTAEVSKTIIGGIRVGLPRKSAAALAGVAYDTMQEWIRRGKDTDSDRESSALYAEFAVEVEKARAEFQTRHLQNIHKHSTGFYVTDSAGNRIKERSRERVAGKVVGRDSETGAIIVVGPGGEVLEDVHDDIFIKPQWTASAWLLERTSPEEFGTTRQVVEGRVQHEHTLNPVRRLPPARLISRLDAIRDRTQKALNPAPDASSESVVEGEVVKADPHLGGNGNGNGSGH